MSNLKRSSFLVGCGAIMGILVGAVMCYVALQHDPQKAYSDDWLALIELFSLWAFSTFAIVLLSGAVLYLIVALARRYLR